MSKAAAKFTQADVARAIRAIAQTGSNMAVEVIKDGTIRIVPVQTQTPAPAPKNDSPIF